MSEPRRPPGPHLPICARCLEVLAAYRDGTYTCDPPVVAEGFVLGSPWGARLHVAARGGRRRGPRWTPLCGRRGARRWERVLLERAAAW